jgi:hypothetical protein
MTWVKPASVEEGWVRVGSDERLASQTTSKFPFCWWGMNSTLSDKHQFDEPLGPHSKEEETLDASESRV